MNEEQNDIEQSATEADATDAEGQGARYHRADQPTPPKDTGAGATESDDDDVEGPMPARYR